MNKNKSFAKSLKCAVSGLLKPFAAERNMRIHFSIANLIILFAHFYGLNRDEWAVLFLTIGLVITAELVNTAVENAVDTATSEISQTAKTAKDTAAGAVLFAAVISVAIGCFLFLDIQRIQSALTCVFSSPAVYLPCIALGTADILFIILGGKIKFRTK